MVVVSSSRLDVRIAYGWKKKAEERNELFRKNDNDASARVHLNAAGRFFSLSCYVFFLHGSIFTYESGKGGICIKVTFSGPLKHLWAVYTIGCKPEKIGPIINVAIFILLPPSFLFPIYPLDWFSIRMWPVERRKKKRRNDVDFVGLGEEKK